MERTNKHRSRRDHKALRKAPKVPIKTYRWEDIRRARRRGGYPWTYLYKRPFTEKVDPEQFTMDAFRREKSASFMGRRSDRVDISDVSSWADYSGKTTPTLLQELISEPGDDVPTKRGGSRPGSVVIEEYVEEDDKALEDDVQIKEFHLDSAESSDNISQYLDKEDRAPGSSKASLKGSRENVNGRQSRAKSEETVQRKRRLSAESSQSKYSLSKLAVMKKLQDVRRKVKIPKISFPTKKPTRKRNSLPKEDKAKKPTKKTVETALKKVDKPVYIYIPLKPPPGETDEFSYLEFEPKKDNGEAVTKTLEEPKKKEEDMDEESKEKDQSPFSTLERGPKVTKKPPLKINPAFKQFLKDVRQLKEKEEEEERNKAETEHNKAEEAENNQNQKPTEIKPEEAKAVTSDEEEVLDLEEQQLSDTESPKEDLFEKLFEASSSKADIQPVDLPRNVRSKSAEPERKRRSSMDSSYSRKSMSKLAIMKKIKGASEKIKNALSMDSLRNKIWKKEEPVKKVKEKKPEKSKHKKLTATVKLGQMDKPKPVEPVYIHIPLKPPEGATDEFSHLASEPIENGAAPPKKEERTDSLDSNSPGPAQNGDIQFIFLTPPSDDELLDKEPDIPETPSSSDDVVFFSSLKKLAEDVVDKVSPETKRKRALDTVTEENASDRSSSNEPEAIATEKMTADDREESEHPPAKKEDKGEKVIVDVEDGLSETQKTEELLKPALKTPTTESSSPSPKRVSFKRKSKKPKDADTDSAGYQVIGPPKEVTAKPDADKITPPEPAESKPKLPVRDLNQSVSADEEKSHLDRKIVKNTSLEEDYNEWLHQGGDHEYESVDPPEEVTVMTTTVLPSVTVVDGDSDPKVVISASEILDKPVEEKKKPFFQFSKFQKDKNQGERDKSQERGSSDSHSRSSQGRDLPEGVDEHPKPSGGPNKFQAAFKQRTEQLKTKTNELRNKIHNIKKPQLHMPNTSRFKPHMKKPDLSRFKIEKPKINLHLPKIPDSATIHLPHISLPGARKSTETRTVEERQYSTESNVDDSERLPKRHKFDLSSLSFSGTFPRFKKTRKDKDEAAFATVPRAKKEKEKKVAAVSSEGSSTRIPLHSEDSMDAVEERLDLGEESQTVRPSYNRETSHDINRRKSSSDFALEDEYERETQAINRADYLNRWQHGNFKERRDSRDNEDERIVGELVEQRFGRIGQGYGREDKPETLEERLRRDEEKPRYIEDEDEFDLRLRQNKHMVTDLDNLEDDQAGQTKDGYSSEGSVNLQTKGRLGKLDIDSDEFFVVHEIREGFQTPANALAQMNEYDPIGSNRSLPTQIRDVKRTPIKKPKRKKTPHVSQEEIPGDEESMEGVSVPSRPRRRSKRNKKKVMEEEAVPYQETIPVDPNAPHGQRLDFPRESLGILGDDEGEGQEFEMYENEMMQGKETPSVLVTDPYKPFGAIEPRFAEKSEPTAPPRKHRSLKSLTQSENESILTEGRFDDDNSFNVAILEDQIIQPSQELTSPPRRPSRRSRSQTSSLSRVSLPPSRDTDSIFTDEGYLAEDQQIPSYLIENRNFKEQYPDTKEAPIFKNEEQRPCVEEPCFQDIRDYMGYSVLDKTKVRDPPLPPPRTPARRRKRAATDTESKFSTVPRNMGLSQAPPVRPLRNYSTLSHVQPHKRDPPFYENGSGENKENEVDIGQHIDIDDDVNRDLVSGDVVQKMRQRPLPAPPRPPRKTKTIRKSLQDITSKENIIPSQSDPKGLQEETVSTQTEPLPPDFVCEEIRREPNDTIITPRLPDSKFSKPEVQPEVERFQLYDPRAQKVQTKTPQIRRELITPSVYTFEETVTHGTLLVQPLDGAKVVPDHQLSKERLVPVTKAFSDDDEETSEVPESFRQLRSPESGIGEHEGPRREVFKAEKLQVADLDVDRLTVNQLQASKLIVSEIDASTISTSEIQGKSGKIVLGDIELPSSFLEQLVQKPLDAQKKTPISEDPLTHRSLEPVEPPSIERQYSDVTYSEVSPETPQREASPEPPMPPPRGCTLDESLPDAPPRTLRRKSRQDSPRLVSEEPQVPPPNPLRNEMLEPEIDDHPPPRPPQPQEAMYFPSQPPASFYALRAKQYVEENIPTAPRRKRRHSTRSRPVSRSRSSSDDSSLPQRPARTSRRASEPSITDLSGRLVRACSVRVNGSLKRLIYHLTENLLRNADGKQDLHVFMVILLVLIAGLILLGYGEDRTVVHLHHWEYFNPPRDL